MLTAAQLLNNARMKVSWAGDHIERLDRTMAEFQASDFCAVATKFNEESGDSYLEVTTKQVVPSVFALLTGDAIHNLRSSLDHLATAIVGKGNRNTYFPFHTEVNQFKSCQKLALLEKARPGLGEFIAQTIRPYKQGNYPLWALNKLDVTDKHEFLVPTVSVVGVEINDVIDGMNNSFGQIYVKLGPGNILRPFGSRSRITVRGEIKPTYEIFFPSGEQFAGQAVIPTLVQLRDIILETFQAIEGFLDKADRESSLAI